MTKRARASTAKRLRGAALCATAQERRFTAKFYGLEAAKEDLNAMLLKLFGLGSPPPRIHRRPGLPVAPEAPRIQVPRIRSALTPKFRVEEETP